MVSTVGLQVAEVPLAAPADRAANVGGSYHEQLSTLRAGRTASRAALRAGSDHDEHNGPMAEDEAALALLSVVRYTDPDGEYDGLHLTSGRSVVER